MDTSVAWAEIERENIWPVEPTWSFSRFGKTETVLADGTRIFIAGEYEDYYHPQFFIYNDVTVVREGDIEHFLYSTDAFPPTDFHTATPDGDWIWIIGSLGYAGQRRHGETQVLRLNLKDFSIERCDAKGESPGWIFKHSAELKERCIIISGGRVESEENYAELVGKYALNLDSLVWTKVNSSAST